MYSAFLVQAMMAAAAINKDGSTETLVADAEKLLEWVTTKEAAALKEREKEMERQMELNAGQIQGFQRIVGGFGFNS